MNEQKCRLLRAAARDKSGKGVAEVEYVNITHKVNLGPKTRELVTKLGQPESEIGKPHIVARVQRVLKDGCIRSNYHKLKKAVKDGTMSIRKS